MSTLTLTLTSDEIDAVLLGLRLIVRDEEGAFAAPAEAVTDRILTLLPRPQPRSTPTATRKEGCSNDWPAVIRAAIVHEESLDMAYVDRRGSESRRRICPVSLDVLGEDGLMAAWCERRLDFRHFRLDRIRELRPTGKPYPQRHRLMLAAWRTMEGADDGW